jgi:hypothetical protein
MKFIVGFLLCAVVSTSHAKDLTWEQNGFAFNLPAGFSRTHASDAFQLINAQGVGLTVDAILASSEVAPVQEINKWSWYAETELLRIAGRHGSVTMPLHKEKLSSGSILYTLGETSTPTTNGNRFGLFFVLITPSGDFAQMVFEGPGDPDTALSEFRPFVVSASWMHWPNKTSKRTR